MCIRDRLHIDTGHNLPEVLDYRDGIVARGGHRLVVARVEEWIADGRLQERADGTRNPLQTIPLLDTIAAERFDALLGGARRDEDREMCIRDSRCTAGSWVRPPNITWLIRASCAWAAASSSGTAYPWIAHHHDDIASRHSSRRPSGSRSRSRTPAADSTR